MNAKELRINNLVCPVQQAESIKIPAVDVIHKIVSIEIDGVKTIFGNQILATVAEPFKMDYWGICGIPLTEEWLENKGYVGKIIEQSGFVKKYIHFEIGGRISIDIYGDNNEIWIFWKGQLIRDYKKYYVHQLQNLYFALTGEELEIKL